MILILTEPLDPHADHVGEKLRERGADFVRLDHAQFPSQAEISLSYSVTGQVWYTLRAGKESINLSYLKAVWYRRPKLPLPHEEIRDTLSRGYVEEECKTFLNDAWNSLDCLWLPAPPPVIQQAQFKA